MPKIRRIDFSPDEWIAGTVGLSNAERGLYITACALIYSHGGPIPQGELRRACLDHGNGFNSQLRKLVRLGKLIRNDGEIDQKRCRKELENARKRSEYGRENAVKRWKNNAIADAVAVPHSNGSRAFHQPSTIISEEASASSDIGAHDARNTTEERGNGGSARRAKPKTRIAPDWQPDLADCAYAAGRGWDARRIGEEADAFADRCHRDQPVYADWHAAWRTWVRNADKFAARPNGEAPGRHTAARSGSFATAARNVAARYDDGGK